MSLAKAHWLWLTWGIAASLAGVATNVNVNYFGKLILFSHWSKVVFFFILFFLLN